MTAKRDILQKQTPLARAIPKLQRETRATVKSLRQRIAYRGEAKTAAFIFGCQRSGTNMLIEVLEQSPLTRMYQEDNQAAFVKNRIKPIEVQRDLVERAACPLILFKPIADSQHADQLLDAHADAKALWIYRDVDATSASAVAKWGHTQISLIRQLCTDTLPPHHWLSENLSAERRAWACDLFRSMPNISAHEAAAIKWALRNAIYFDLGLDKQAERVMLVKYEDLARDPAHYFPPVFDFLGISFDPAYISGVRSSAPKSPPPMESRLRGACDAMTAQLDQVYQR